MAFQLEVNDLVEVKLYAFSQGQYSINTLHYRVTAEVGTGAFDADAAQEIGTNFGDALREVMSNNASYLGCSAQILLPTRRPRVLFEGNAGAGSVDDEILPRQVAGLIRKKSNFASRSGRGRMYVPFPAEQSNTALGFPSPAYLVNLNILAGLLDDPQVAGGGGNTATLSPIIFNRTTNVGTPITGFESATTWATCRRRSDVRGGDRAPF